jgi:hypothetical protein
MKSFIIVVLTAATGLATACTSKTTVVEPVTAAPAPPRQRLHQWSSPPLDRLDASS